MIHPEHDLEDRSVVWDYMQNFWMDTDSTVLLPEVGRICAESKYSLDELEAIFWNEVRPAVSFNMAMLPAPEWAGFDVEWLKQRVLKKHRFGRSLPRKWLHPYSASWWSRLRVEIENYRN
ncbi:MAG: hypothetical protein R3F37_15855 [Candidatus Competibacteraceae bacterium]